MNYGLLLTAVILSCGILLILTGIILRYVYSSTNASYYNNGMYMIYAGCGCVGVFVVLYVVMLIYRKFFKKNVTKLPQQAQPTPQPTPQVQSVQRFQPPKNTKSKKGKSRKSVRKPKTKSKKTSSGDSPVIKAILGSKKSKK